MAKTKFSKDIHALLIELSDKPRDYAEQSGQLAAHFTKVGEPVLLEILDVRDFPLDSLSSVVKGTEVTLL